MIFRGLYDVVYQVPQIEPRNAYLAVLSILQTNY